MGRVQTGVFDNLIRRLFSIKGGGSELSETLGDVFPTLDLENLPMELLLLRGWHSFTGFLAVAGVAAQATGLQLINIAVPGNSIVVLDKVIIRAEITNNLSFGVNLAPFTTTINTQNIDTRNPQQFNAIARIGSSQDALAAATSGSIRPVAAIDMILEAPSGLAVLAPGSAFSLISGVDNSDLTVTFFGRERQVEPSELSF